MKDNIEELIIHDKNKYYNKIPKMSKEQYLKYEKTADYVKHAPQENHLRGYNFCGPHTNLQLRLKDPTMYETKIRLAGKKIVGTKPYGKPINSFDKVCMEHDIAYDKAITMEDIKKADDIMVRDIKKVKDKLKKHKKWKRLPYLSKEKRDYIILKNIIKYKRKINSLNFTIINKALLDRDKSIKNLKSLNKRLINEEKILYKYKNNYLDSDKIIIKQQKKVNKLKQSMNKLTEKALEGDSRSLSISKHKLNKLLKYNKKTIKKIKNKIKKTKKKTKNKINKKTIKKIKNKIKKTKNKINKKTIKKIKNKIKKTKNKINKKTIKKIKNKIKKTKKKTIKND
jgi:hypothetical protein